MKTKLFAGAMALGLVCVSGAALADDPNDPVLARSAAARARDHAIIKKLNEDQLAYVRQRDAGYAAGWQAYAEGRAVSAAPGRRADRDDDAAYARDQDRYTAEQGRYQAGQADYARSRSEYEDAMADWRQAVSACRNGRYEYCAR